MLNSCLLRLFHLIYAALLAYSTRQKAQGLAHPLTAKRKKLPSHLCLVLVPQEGHSRDLNELAFLDCLKRVAAWCRVTGIPSLTAYDSQGILLSCSDTIQEQLSSISQEGTEDESTEPEIEYPLTPPISEPPASRSHSPTSEFGTTIPTINVVSIQCTSLKNPRQPCRRRNVAVKTSPLKTDTSLHDLTIYLASRDSGKPAVASIAECLARDKLASPRRQLMYAAGQYLTAYLRDALEGPLPCPDLMVVYQLGSPPYAQRSIELHGYPPWQLNLTEMHCTPPKAPFSLPISSSDLALAAAGTPMIISETDFCRALDEFAGAEMRLGK